jgi:hypothetical protein
MKDYSRTLAVMRCLLVAGLFFLVAGCSGNRQYETAMCALGDISGTYADQKPTVVNLIKAGILPSMVPGDSLFFITIDSNSYNEDNLKQKVTLDYRPSYANRQKLEFANALDDFAASNARSSYTDISGAMMLCGDYLKSTGAGTKLMFIFSDMEEDLEQGVTRVFEKDEFDGIHIAAMNVIKLAKDSSDPQVYRDRLRDWDKKVMDAGAAEWQVLFQASHIPEFIEKAKKE